MSGKQMKRLRKFNTLMGYNDRQYSVSKELYKKLPMNKKRELNKEMRQFQNEKSQSIKEVV